VLEIDGHDYSHIISTLNTVKVLGESNQPTLIVAHTIKGKGVRLTEGKHAWHSKVATQEELKEVAAELGIEEELA
jgi:transketolase